MMRNRFSSACRRAAICASAIGSLLLLSSTTALSAPAVLVGISIAPPEPTTCDPVSITVGGELPICYEIVSATIRAEAIPCASPLPCTRFHVEITVREPAPGTVCPAATSPYTRSFDVSRLPAGVYSVSAREHFVTFAADSTDSTVGERFATANFAVRGDPACSPQGCYILSFSPDRLTDPFPTPNTCTAVVSPGGTACLAVSLLNEPAVGGLQTKLVFPPIVTVSGGPGRFFRAVSVEAIGRAAGFQVAWTTERSETRILLYSTSGSTIPAGSGPVLRICYAVARETPFETFFLQDVETIVADAAGVAMIPCPTFRRIPPGTICVGSPVSCDLNGDGSSDVLDVIRLVRCALGAGSDSIPACPPDTASADCNGDGRVDIRDVICCVRKIVGFQVGTIENPLSPEILGNENSIGFEGVPRWTSDVEGTATVRIDAAANWGGTQFVLNPRGAPVRIRGVSLDPASAREGTQLEFAIDELGIARVMLYEAGSGARSAHSYRMRVLLEREPSGAGSGTVRIQAARAGTREGVGSGITTFNPSVQIDAAAVAAPALLAARPNPSAGETEIGFVLPADARVTLRVYDVAGRLVRTLVDEVRPAGVHRARWDGTDDRGNAARTGLYFTKMNVGSTIRSERVLLLR